MYIYIFVTEFVIEYKGGVVCLFLFYTRSGLDMVFESGYLSVF